MKDLEDLTKDELEDVLKDMTEEEQEIILEKKNRRELEARLNRLHTRQRLYSDLYETDFWPKEGDEENKPKSMAISRRDKRRIMKDLYRAGKYYCKQSCPRRVWEGD